jgi:hypothetical protein
VRGLAEFYRMATAEQIKRRVAIVVEDEMRLGVGPLGLDLTHEPSARLGPRWPHGLARRQALASWLIATTSCIQRRPHLVGTTTVGCLASL